MLFFYKILFFNFIAPNKANPALTRNNKNNGVDAIGTCPVSGVSVVIAGVRLERLI